MTFAAMLVIAYISGALPWSVWLGRAFYGTDPREYGDGNPGATNAYRAAGWRLGVPVMLLDYLKGAVPVLIAHYGLALPNDQLFWVACAPTVGHAFSMFLRFGGGRALAVMFGVWTGLTLYHIPMILGLTALVGIRLFEADELKSLALPIAATIYIVAAGYPLWMIGVAIVQLVVLVGKIAHHHFWQFEEDHGQVPV